MKKWFEIKNKTVEKAEIWIYEFIGKDFWSDDGITAKDFQKELSAIKSNQIDLHINSPGGEVFDGIAIYNMLKQHPAKVTTYIDGLAGSIASVIALAGDEVYMAENALFMIHNPIGGLFVYGGIEDIQSESAKLIDALKAVKGSILNAYEKRTGREEGEITAWMGAETWMDAEQAKENGFVDDITDQLDMAACAKFVPILNKMGMKNIPSDLAKQSPKTITKRDIERALRDVGCTQTMAKAILADGWMDEGTQRDVEPEPVTPPQRDVVKPKKDRVADLLTRAELVAPSVN